MASTTEGLFAAIDAGDTERVGAILGQEPALATSRDPAGVSALMRARYRFDPALVDAVRAHVGDLDVFEAASFGDVDRLAALLDADPSLASVLSADGFTALHFAAFFAQPEAAALLLGRGAVADAHGSGWMTGTPLHSAATSGSVEIARMLLDAGADPNARQSHGWTPLHSAAQNGNAPLAALLLERGADPAARNDDGTTVLELAREGGDAGTIAAVEAALG
ncbi:MAG: ankyrin repeat domain-containing protein [Planctomycetaceae bacterium]